MTKRDDPAELLTPAEVAAIMRVNAKTVTRWAVAGKIRSIRTIGGHRRFFAEDFDSLFKATGETHEGPIERPADF